MEYSEADKKLILAQIEKHVHEILSGEGTGHDWWHVVRVVNNTRLISKTENCNQFIAELAALVHDIGDHKLHNGDETASRREISTLFEKLELDQDLTEKIIAVVEEVSFKGANVETPVSCIEAAIVQDADRLDAIGAIGIARTFAYGGSKSREIYNPGIPPVMHNDFDSYKKSTAPTINHFYEKLLLLKDLMKTESGRNIAKQRHEYMIGYLDQFYSEWNSN